MIVCPHCLYQVSEVFNTISEQQELHCPKCGQAYYDYAHWLIKGGNQAAADLSGRIEG